MQYAAHSDKSFVNNTTKVQRSIEQTLLSTRELGMRLKCLPAEVERELQQRKMPYHKNFGGILWQLY